MAGLVQIIIYLLCVYLIFKGVEIFQIGYVSESSKRTKGIVIGITMIIIAVIVCAIALYMEADVVSRLSNINSKF